MGEAGYASGTTEGGEMGGLHPGRGCVTAGALVTEQYLLDLEREAFLSLCGERKTQERSHLR